MSLKRYDTRPQPLLDKLQDKVCQLEKAIAWNVKAAAEQDAVSEAALRQRDIYMRSVEQLEADLEQHQKAIAAITE